MRIPTKRDSLADIRRAGLVVDCIFDVGVLDRTRELQEVFPDRRHYLFEPVAEFYPAIRRNYRGFDYELVEAAVGDRNGTTRLAIKSIRGGALTNSKIVEDGAERPSDYPAEREVRVLRLDDFVRERDIGRNILLKVDVDGTELKVLEGARAILDRVVCVVVEASRKHFQPRLNFLSGNGFALFDIVDLCYYYDRFDQADLIFLRSETIETPEFNGRLRGQFDVGAYTAIDFSPQGLLRLIGQLVKAGQR